MSALVGAFRDDASKARFLRFFEQAMTAWPEREDQTIETSFGSTVVSSTDRAGGAEPVVLLPGGGGTIAAWGPFAHAWSTDRPVIAVDTVWDAGRSVQSRVVAGGAEAAAWIDEVLAGLEVPRVHLVGYSYGGWAAVNQLLRSPERLLSVTAIEPPGTITGIPLRTWARMLRVFLGGEQQYRSFLSWVRQGELPDPPVLDLLVSSRLDFVQRGTPRPERVTTAQWQDLRAPLSILLGGRSPFAPARAASIVRRNAPQVDLEIFPEAGHAVLVEEREALIEHVRTLLHRHDGQRDGRR